MWFSSGRGPEPDDEDIADPFNGKRFTVCMFLPMEIVTFSERVQVVEVGNLVEIPSEIDVRQAISKLYKNKEEHPDKFAYVKFPFGMIDYDGLQMLRTYHKYIAHKKKVVTVNNTLTHIHVDSDDDFMPISVNKLSKHPSTLSMDSDSEDELIKSEKVGRPLILGMLPEGYTYNMVTVTAFPGS